MEINISLNGKMIFNKEEESIILMMVENMKEICYKVKKMEKEFFIL